MKKRYSAAVLALLFLGIGKIGHGQTGYLRFVDNLEDLLIAAHNGGILSVSSLVDTDLSKLNIRRLVHPEHEAVYLQKGYDLNKDKVLNELDGFERVDGEKFSPWNDYMETMPCGEKEALYFEVRALQKDNTPVYLPKMLKLADKTAPSVKCKPSIKVYLNAQDTTLKVYAQDLLADKAYDDCQRYLNPRDTIQSPEVKKFSVEYGRLDIFNPKPDTGQTYVKLDCTHSGEFIPIQVFAWDTTGNRGFCQSWVQVIDTLSLNCTQLHPFRFHDSLELFLQHHFSLGRPLVPASKLLLLKDSLQVGKIKVRRSIRKINLAPWLTLGYDFNQDGLLNEQDGIDLNQDGDKTDEGEYFVEKGNFIWTPFLDSLPLFCSDFGDSLYLESQSMGSSFRLSQYLELSKPNFFVNYHFGVRKILDLIAIADPSGQLIFEGLKAQEFLDSPFYTCLTGNTEPDFWGREQLSFSINVLDEKADSSSQVIKLECCHSNRVILLNIHAWSKHASTSLGNIITYAEVFDEQRYCPSDFSCGPPRILQGKIMDQAGLSISGGMVKIDGDDEILGNLNVSNNGTFAYQNYPWGVPRSDYYLVTPSKNNDPLNGVSTFDLIQIQKHILNLKPFDSPFQYIAADVNRSGTISTLDIIQLRKLILGIDANFSNNSSWRFINAKHIFPDPNDPLKTYLPEKIRVGPLNGIHDVAFIGIKIGDVNFSANPEH